MTNMDIGIQVVTQLNIPVIYNMSSVMLGKKSIFHSRHKLFTILPLITYFIKESNLYVRERQKGGEGQVKENIIIYNHLSCDYYIYLYINDIIIIYNVRVYP